LWVKNYGGSAFDLAAKIVLDDNNNVYTTGRYNNSITFGTSTINAVGTDAFITKFDTAGNSIWVKGISGTGNDEEADIDYENGKLSFIATTSGNVTVDSNNLSALGNLDICIGKIDTAGNVLWAKLLGGSSDDEGSGVALLNSSTYFNGSFKTTANFDAFSLTSQGQWDIVTGKISALQSTGTILNLNDETQVSIYPNPAVNSFKIIFSKEQKNTLITITDVLGRVVITTKHSGKEVTVSRNEMKKGIYFVTIKDINENIIIKKIIFE
jgi:hypothetical protein